MRHYDRVIRSKQTVARRAPLTAVSDVINLIVTGGECGRNTLGLGALP